MLINFVNVAQTSVSGFQLPSVFITQKENLLALIVYELKVNWTTVMLVDCQLLYLTTKFSLSLSNQVT